VNTIEKQPNVPMLPPAIAAICSYILYGILTAASMFTAFYMFRLYCLVFLGESRTDKHTLEHLHTPSNSMRWPLIILAGGATLVGVAGLPAVMAGSYGWVFTILAGITVLGLVYLAFFSSQVDATEGKEATWTPWLLVRLPLLAIAGLVGLLALWALPGVGKAMGLKMPVEYIVHWLKPSISSWQVIQVKGQFAAKHGGALDFYHVSHRWEGILMAIAVGAAVISILAALALYRRGPSKLAGDIAAALGWFYRLVRDKYRIDEVYHWLIVKPYTWFAWLLRVAVDEFLIDKVLVTGTSYVVYGIGWLGSQIQTGRARQYLAAVLVGLAVLLFLVTRPLSVFQTRVAGRSVTVQAGAPGAKVLGPLSGPMKLRVGFDFDNDGKVDTWLKKPTDAATSPPYAKPGKKRIRMVVKDPRFGTTSESTRTVIIKPPKAPDDPAGKEGR
jgi:NADH:ubiquinone oxidoreductase subunit 5 (subunit L)/multisubunit Na+/H+ antiporter MnhA subunit